MKWTQSKAAPTFYDFIPLMRGLNKIVEAASPLLCCHHHRTGFPPLHSILADYGYILQNFISEGFQSVEAGRGGAGRRNNNNNTQ